MNQESFRSFLTTPRPGASPSTARPGSSTGMTLGNAAPKRGYNPYTTKPPTKESQDLLKPRKVKSNKRPDKYIDRAAARRQGLEDEYTDVLAVRDEFERRQQEGEEDDIEEKRKMLGGDAEHSILVKGLDMALLARNKAELEAKAGSDDDDELEAAFGAGSSAQPAVDDEPAGKKRTREEILAAVQNKKRVLAGGKAVAGAPAAEELNRSKFKPIGFKEDKKSKKKAVVGTDGQVKKLKKKKKKSAAVEEEAAPSEAPLAELDETSTPAPPSPAAALPPPPAEKKYAKPLIEASLSDDDIFGGVGEYEADLGSDSDDEPKASSSKAGTAVVGEGQTELVKPVNWFSTGRTPSPPPAPAPPAVASPKGKERAHTEEVDDVGAGPSTGRLLSRSPSPEHVMRLVPLSGTSAREMLARAEAAEEAATRRSNKAKWRQAQGLSKQADGDDDDDDEGRSSWRGKKEDQGGSRDKKRLNHEYQQYQNYVKKQDK